MRLVKIYAKTVLLRNTSSNLEAIEHLDAVYLQTWLLEEHIRKRAVLVLRRRSDILQFYLEYIVMPDYCLQVSHHSLEIAA